jgi:hypothetical protein
MLFVIIGVVVLAAIVGIVLAVTDPCGAEIFGSNKSQSDSELEKNLKAENIDMKDVDPANLDALAKMSPQEQKKEIKKNASTLRKGLKVGGIIAAVGTVAALGAWAGYAYYKTTVAAAKRDKTLFLCTSKGALIKSARQSAPASLRLVDFTKFVDMMNHGVAVAARDTDQDHLNAWNEMSSRDESVRDMAQCVAARFWKITDPASPSPVKISDLVATTWKSAGAFSSFKFQIDKLNAVDGGFIGFPAAPFDATSEATCSVLDATLRNCDEATIVPAMTLELPLADRVPFQNGFKVWREDFASFTARQSALAEMLTVKKVANKPIEDSLLFKADGGAADEGWIDALVNEAAWAATAQGPWVAAAPTKPQIKANLPLGSTWSNYFSTLPKGWKPVDDQGKEYTETPAWLVATTNGQKGTAAALRDNGAVPNAYFTNEQMKLLCVAYNKRLADKKTAHEGEVRNWKGTQEVQEYEKVVELMEGIWKKLAKEKMPATPAP